MTEGMPAHVSEAFRAFPDSVRDRLLQIRTMILCIAGETEGVGPLTETLKWGEPAYLTGSTQSGSTIRLGWPRAHPDRTAIYFNCKTSLVSTFREIFPDSLNFSGNRAVLLPIDGPLPEEALALCIGMALTYRKARRSQR
jgi:hypothetical protein